MRHVHPAAALVVCGFLICFLPPSLAAQGGDPLTPIERAIADAERSLRDGELQIAESRYRTALEQGWVLIGALAAADRQFDAAIDALGRASTSRAR